MDIIFKPDECKKCCHEKICSIKNDREKLNAEIDEIKKESAYNPFHIHAECEHYISADREYVKLSEYDKGEG